MRVCIPTMRDRKYIGAKGTVKDAIGMWKDNMLQMATDKNACE